MKEEFYIERVVRIVAGVPLELAPKPGLQPSQPSAALQATYTF